ncbi:MAG: hypothetical protein IPJ69_08660 [Deltaproteobacteria bacterium]|nr:MAG: hypothetical protein IPJ69_08660 [Deltaproteobacteria bacterium]
MNVQQPNRAYPATTRPSVASASTARAKQPGLLSRIGKAVGEILNGPQVVQKQNATNRMDGFQMQKTNYQVSVQKDLNSLTSRGTVSRPSSHLDAQMLAWMNKEVIGSPAPSARTQAPVGRPAIRRA